MDIQRSSEWHGARCGRITASNMKHVLSVSKRDGKPLQARQDYLTALVVERLTGEPMGVPTTPAMQWGKDVEPAAIAAYEARTGEIVQSVGFIVHPEFNCIGASPDGLVRTEGGVEAKCPFNKSVHLNTILNGMPEEHMPQIQCCLWVTDREWWDFISFNPLFPEPFRLYVQRIPRDNGYIDNMKEQCLHFNNEVNEKLYQLQNLRKAA